MTPTPAAADVLTASDWLAFAGVIVAAVLGVGVAVWGQFQARAASRRDALDRALASVIEALGQRAIDLEAWAAPAAEPVVGSMGMVYVRDDRGDDLGGPSDARLQTAVEAAWLLADKRESKYLEALGAATFHLKAARVRWQVARAGQVAASIRSWRSGTLSGEEFLADMRGHIAAAHSDGAARVT